MIYLLIWFVKEWLIDVLKKETPLPSVSFPSSARESTASRNSAGK